MKTQTNTALTIKQEVTAVTHNVIKSDGAKHLFFAQSLKRIREAGSNEQLINAIVTAIDSEIKSVKATDNNKKVVKNILTTAKNYHSLNLSMAFDSLEYNNVHSIVSLLSKLKATDGDTVGYKADKDSEIVQVDKEGAISTIVTALSIISKSETLKGLESDVFKIAYNNMVNESITSFAKQYGKKVQEEENVESIEELISKNFNSFNTLIKGNETQLKFYIQRLSEELTAIQNQNKEGIAEAKSA